MSRPRPRVTLGSRTSAIPAAFGQPSSRTLTVGTCRGNNVTDAVSGSGSTASSVAYSVDCVDFY